VAVMESAVRIQEVLDGVGQEEGVGVVILRVESGHARDVKDYVRIIASWLHLPHFSNIATNMWHTCAAPVCAI
jgi:hypothetical protein